MPFVFGENHFRDLPGPIRFFPKGEDYPLLFPEGDSIILLIAAPRILPLVNALLQAPWKRIDRVALVVSEAEALRADLLDPKVQAILAEEKFSLGLAQRSEDLTVENYVRLLGPKSISSSGKTHLISFGNVEDHFRQLQNLHRPALALQAARFHPLDYALVRDIPMGFGHTLRNLARIYRSPDLRALHKKFQNHTAIVVGAGPSLQKQWDLARKLSEHALVIGADTLLKPAAERGLRLDVISSIERDPEIISLLDQKVGVDQTLLVGSAVLDPRSFEVYGGPQSLILPAVDFIQSLPIKRMIIPCGHTCVALGLQIAILLGCKTIFLQGVDLAFSPEGVSHISNVPYGSDQEFTALMDVFRMSSYDVASNQGGKIKTQFYWSMYRNELELMISRASANFFNLSPTGAKIAGAPYIEGDEALKMIKTCPSFTFKDIAELLPYDRNSEAREELSQWRTKLARWEMEIELFRRSLESRDQWISYLRQALPEFQFMLSPMVRRVPPGAPFSETQALGNEVLGYFQSGVSAASQQIEELEKDVQLF